MFDGSDTNTSDERHNSVAGEERRGTDPSVIGNVNTTRGGGAESTSTLGSVVGVERPETGGGIRVSVDPGGDLETVISALVATALEKERKAATAVDPTGDLTSQVAALVAKALRESGDMRATGRGVKSGVRSTTSVPSGTGRALLSGVELRAAPRTTKEQSNIGVTSKFNRGDTSHDRRKTKAFACKAMTTKLSCTSAASIITSADHAKYDIAVECLGYQQQLGTMELHLRVWDMKSVFLMPLQFRPSRPDSISGPYTDVLTDFRNVSMDRGCAWQDCLNQCASSVDVETMEWCRDYFMNSMDDDLKLKVVEDMNELDENERGPITMYLSMTKHMVASNAESREATEEWVRKFNILNFDGENVTNAVKLCKAAVRSLDASGGIPANVLSNLLNGFMNATNQEFKTVCATALSLTKFSSPLAGQSKTQQIFTHLASLETYFVDLNSGEKWNGLGHSAAVFKAHSTEYLQANAVGRLPFDEWVKGKACRICGELGHLGRDCPKNKDKEHDSFKRSSPGGRGRGRGYDGRRGRGRGRGHDRNARFKRAFLSAWKSSEECAEEAETANSGSVAENNAIVEEEDTVEDDEDDDVDDHDEADSAIQARAARMFASLNE